MNTVHTVSALPVSFDMYIRHGWSLVPIPHGTKGPRTTGWNKKENCLTNSSALPEGYGVGLAHAYSGTMALDIDDWTSATKLLTEHGIDLQTLMDAPDAVTINSGMAGHGKLIYTMPFGLTLPSKKINSEGNTSYELRCATSNQLTVQDVMPPSIHPSTNQPYQWGGRGHWQRLPTIPMALLTLWQSLIEQDTIKNISIGTKQDVSYDDIKVALNSIPADCSRDDWLNVGMALHSLNNDEALTIWNDWSATATEKYKGIADILTCWKSFKTRDDGIKIATLFHIAIEHGYTRPIADISGLFANITPSKPMSIIDGLKTPVPVMDIDLFPAILATRARELAYQIGCDPLVPLMAGLGACFCSALPR